ncbi:type II toxin-antitoxin system Phd/YefM family antitoxin [Methylobacterium sp. Leaf113]|uniref:type II toxin-antitoxin system Phd/YefM family antitoxin n=1 Tax=Methylobacterium sp. Leaf113 TaxID=1736259 RepID=UPI001FCD4619|nr:type II toxin-antitoxin system Phd/YefM family antitoxin [Methylobacterium sp. Leaf113]
MRLRAMTHVGFTELRKNPATHFDRVETDRAELVVTRQNTKISSSYRLPSSRACVRPFTCSGHRRMPGA